MNSTLYLPYATLMVGVAMLYLRLARYFRIIDKPNERSSHVRPTIRGGGVLFWVAALCAYVYGSFAVPYFFAGLTLAALISFLDDLFTLPNRYRIGVQFVSVALLLQQTGCWPAGAVWAYPVLLVVGVGILNAYNFMDGINGITAFYSFVTVGTLWYWQQQTLPAEPPDALLPFVLISLLIFGYLNARRQAVCFAGDVGSVSMAVIILYALMQVVQAEGTFLPILLLAVYGVDSVLTILHRLYLRQNIFQAHRLHLFQLLVHRLGWPHLHVAGLYALVQLTINVGLTEAINWPVAGQWWFAGGLLTALSLAYGLIKKRLITGRA